MLASFACTLFVSAALLFLVQPMIGKVVLPRLGGTPAVWNTCMVFFQAVLLAGYGYTHALNAQKRHRQLIAHLAILLLPLLVLPFSMGNWSPPPDDDPVVPVLWLLFGMVGLPFFVVATSAPLLQRWFATTGHPAAADPYFLYGASNLGSMVGLLAYPALVEPNFDRDTQAWLWAAGYVILIFMVAGCAMIVSRHSDALKFSPTGALARQATQDLAAPEKPAMPSITKRRGRHWKMSAANLANAAATFSGVTGAAFRQVTLFRRLRWIGLAAVPSSLMLGVTTYMTTDIAAVPFFWVMPLALYLLTFILVFARWPVPWAGIPHKVLLYVQPFLVMGLVLTLVASLPKLPTWGYFAAHLLGFFATALVCHGELAKDRPAARHLTAFYLCMAIGGVLGGMFNALVAPQVFWFGTVEYYLAIVLACCLRPPLLGKTPLIPGDSNSEEATFLGLALDWLIPAATAFSAYYLAKVGAKYQLQPYFLAAAVVLVFTLAGRPLRYGLAVGCLILGVVVYDRSQDPFLFEGRSFFGFVKVRASGYASRYHTLVHGGINHGAQIVEPISLRREKITYFHPTSGIGQIFNMYSWPDARLPTSLVGLGPVPFGVLVGMHSEPPYADLGLGTGTVAAHARPWQHLVFYEIDPLVVRLSVPPEGEKPYFYYVQDARNRGAKVEIIVGDGRLNLQKDSHVNPYIQGARRRLDRYFHIIVVDAFSSDAIPVHLLTSEAVELYLEKLADNGVLVFNVTNRYVDIRPILGKIAAEKNLTCLTYGDDSTDNEGKVIPDKFGSEYVVMQRKTSASHAQRNGTLPLTERLNMSRWQATPISDRPTWTDKYSNLLSALNWWN